MHLTYDVIDIIDYELSPVQKPACLLTEVTVVYVNF